MLVTDRTQRAQPWHLNSSVSLDCTSTTALVIKLQHTSSHQNTKPAQLHCPNTVLWKSDSLFSQGYQPFNKGGVYMTVFFKWQRGWLIWNVSIAVWLRCPELVSCVVSYFLYQDTESYCLILTSWNPHQWLRTMVKLLKEVMFEEFQYTILFVISAIKSRHVQLLKDKKVKFRPMDVYII